MDNLFELLCYAYTEYNSVETPEFKAMVDPLSDKLKNLASNDDEAYDGADGGVKKLLRGSWSAEDI